jgi:hypothetical protein
MQALILFSRNGCGIRSNPEHIEVRAMHLDRAIN